MFNFSIWKPNYKKYDKNAPDKEIDADSLKLNVHISFENINKKKQGCWDTYLNIINKFY